MNLTYIKSLGKEKSDKNLLNLIELYKDCKDITLKREIVSSIGRQKNNDVIYDFLVSNAFSTNYMTVVYQMYRTTLYKSKEQRFLELGEKMLKTYDNEMMNKMKRFFVYRHDKSRRNTETIYSSIQQPTLLTGDCTKSLLKIQDKTINFIFTSPPYYNAKEYSDYNSYKEYLLKMKSVLNQCYRVLEDGRFIIINVSPVITNRPGREFESIRYPIHFDFHNILTETGFDYIDDIVWIKPEFSVPNRIGGFIQTRTPLSYKPNCITESLLVYRKRADFLLDKNLKKYSKTNINSKIDADSIDTTNCWYISPKSDKKHPAIFPEELCERVIKYYSYENDLVLDPFAGSGTFGRVAKRMKRIPVLCEINNDYIKLMEKENYEII